MNSFRELEFYVYSRLLHPGSEMAKTGEFVFSCPSRSNPLVENGFKLIPSVTRVFSARRELNVFLQAYQENATSIRAVGDRSLIAYVGLYRGQKNVFETAPKRATPNTDSRLGTAPIRFNIDLNGIAPGRYECQVSVLDPAGGKVAFWVTPIVVVP